jgi:glycosyltransferase involved in cell wall biosynthesis
MAKRKQVGLIFSYNENWIGGSYYILNLINALNTLDDSKKPSITIFSWNDKEYNHIIETGYPYLSFRNLVIPYPIHERVINTLSRLLLKRNVITRYYTDKEASAVFPYRYETSLQKIPAKLFWIADFQDIHYPEFFKAGELVAAKEYRENIYRNNQPVVFSSKNAASDFQHIFPNCTNLIATIRFAVTHPSYQEVNLTSLLDEFSLQQEYFIAPNQFWKHKNHIIILKAVKLLKEEGVEVQVAFTGKEYDHRNPDYTESLKKYVSENGLQNNIKFLGFIDRRKQLKLMKHAISVIQPSLFEGWSTVVEDAKAMNQFILVSDLPIHREQLNYNCKFFNPANARELAELLKSVRLQKPSIEEKDYGKAIHQFAEDFLTFLNQVNA